MTSLIIMTSTIKYDMAKFGALISGRTFQELKAKIISSEKPSTGTDNKMFVRGTNCLR